MKEKTLLYDALFENPDLLIIGVDIKGRIMLFNPACERISGYSRDEVIGRRFWDFNVPEEARDDTAGILEDLEDKGSAGPLKYLMINKDGSRSLIAWNLSPVKDAGGEIELILGVGMDITERRRAEREISGSEEHFRLLIENALDLITVIKPDGTMDYVGPSVERLLGYSPEELIGTNLLDIIHPDEEETARAAMDFAAGRPGVTGNIEVRVRHRDGSWRVHEASAYNLLDNPAVEGMVINSRDVTERISAESLLKAQRDLALVFSEASDLGETLERSFGAVLEATGMDSGGVYLLDEESGYLDLVYHEGLSPSLVEEHSRLDAGSPQAELVRTGNSLFQSIRDIEIPHTGALLDEGLSYIAVVPLLHAGKVIGSINLSSHALDNVADRTRDMIEVLAGQIGEYVARARLMSALRESEERHRLIYEHAGEMIFSYGKDLRMIGVNQAASEFIGYSEDELVGRSILELGILHPDDIPKAARSLERFFAGEDTITTEYRMIRRDGEVVTAEVVGSALRGPQGEIEAIVSIAHDITRRREAERFIRIQRDLAVDLSAAVTVEEASRRALEAILEATGLESGGICLADPDTGEMRPFCGKGLPEGFAAFAADLSRDFNVFEDAGRGPLYVDLEREDIQGTGALVDEDVGKLAVFPIRHEEKLAGYACVISRGPEGMPESTRDMIEVLVGQAGQAINRARLVSALRDSEKRYRLLHDDAGLAIFTYDRDLTMISVNSRACEQIGYTEEELVGRNILELAILHPDDYEKAAKGIEALLSGERTYTEELRLRHKDGSYVIVEMTGAALYDEEGRIIAISDIVTDITDRKRAEEALRESEESYRVTFESTGTAMIILGLDGTILDANREVAKLFGYERDEVVGKMKYMEFVHPEDRDLVRQYSLKLLAREIRGPVQYEARTIRGDGAVLDTLINVSVLPGINRSVASIIDLTEKKEYERELESRAEQLRDFLDIAAHELRHPAALVRGYADTLETYGAEMERADFIGSMHAIERGTDQITEVVENLMDVSRFERGPMAVSPEALPLEPLVERAIREMTVRNSDSTIEMDLADGLEAVRLDPEKIFRLLIILLDNAVKYSPPGSMILVTGKSADGEALISVLDRGDGVPEDEKERIFERFYQRERVLHHSHSGLGLGLYIARRIVEAHGGKIWYEDREGGGAAFRFTLPQ